MINGRFMMNFFFNIKLFDGRVFKVGCICYHTFNCKIIDTGVIAAVDSMLLIFNRKKIATILEHKFLMKLSMQR